MTLKLILLLAAGLVLAAPALAGEAPRNKATIERQEDISDLPGRQFVLLHNDFVPGAVSPLHRHAGDQWSVVEFGEVSVSVNGGPEQPLKAGQMIHIPAGAPHVAYNRTAAPARVTEMFVIEKGKPLVDFVPRLTSGR